MMSPALIRLLVAAILVAVSLPASRLVAQESNVVRIGIIGLDTSHAPAFTKLFNQEEPPEALAGFRVVAAYPKGSETIETSYSRIPKYTESVKALGVEIVDSVAALIDKVDVVLLETNDGKPHLAQALEVFRAGKPVFIDKPVAATLADAIAIYRLADKYGVPMFSSSSLRFNSTVQAARSGEFGKVMGCDAYSPCSLEPSHVDLFWYGIHGCEILYTCMGAGCQTVRNIATEDQEYVVGTWNDGRIGTYRGMRNVKVGYGGHAYCQNKVRLLGPHEGYEPLIVEIAEFFRTHRAPIDPLETQELYAFMAAAAKSKAAGGKSIAIADVLAEANAEADQILERLED